MDKKQKDNMTIENPTSPKEEKNEPQYFNNGKVPAPDLSLLNKPMPDLIAEIKKGGGSVFDKSKFAIK